MKIVNILLPSHGTGGARAAEAVALDLAQEHNALLHQLLVVPDFWKGMMGDDWLNNAVTQARFGDYVENQLAVEAADEINRVAKMAKDKAITYSYDIKLGNPTGVIVEQCAAGRFDCVVMGSPRPKGMAGYRSRVTLEKLVRGISAHLIIIPNPNR